MMKTLKFLTSPLAVTFFLGVLCLSAWSEATARNIVTTRQTGDSQTAKPCSQSSAPLVVGQAIVCSPVPNDAHEYVIENLEAGDYIHLEVEQRGVDVILLLTGPEQFERKRNWPSDNRGFEYLSFVAPVARSYHLKITVDANTKLEPGSNYSLVLSERKKPGPADLSRAKAEELFDLGREKKDAAEKIQLLGRAVTEWRNSGDRYGLATGLTSWGFAKGSTEEIFTNQDGLLKIYKEALEIWEAFRERQRQVLLVLYIARVYDVNALLNRSVEYYRQALTLYLEPDTPKSAVLQAAILNNLGTAQHRLEDEEDAIDSFKGAIGALQGQGQDRLEAITNNNLGQLYLDLGRLDEAGKCFERAQEIRKNKDFDPLGWSTTRHNQGGLEERRGNLDKAEGYIREALQLRQNAPREFESLHLLAYVMNLKGDTKEALALYQRVLPFVVSRPAEKAVTLLNIGGLYNVTGQTDKALGTYKLAFDLLSLIDSPALEWQILFALGRSEREHNQLDSAQQHLAKAYETILRQSRRRINLNLRALYLAGTRIVAETYVDTLMRLSAERRDLKLREKAFEVSEQARSRSLIELLKEANVGIYKDVDPKLLEQASNLEKQLQAADYIRQERKFNQAPAILQKAAESRVKELSEELEALDTTIRRSNRRFADLLTIDPFAVRQLTQTLDENTVALEFMLGDKQSYAWLVSVNGIIAAELLPPRAEIEMVAGKYYQMLRDEDQNFASLGKRVSDMLLRPFADKIRGKSLLIIPDGQLYYVPFSALPVPSDDSSNAPRVTAQYMVKQQPITVLPSLSTLMVQRETLQNRSRSPQALAVFADPVYDINDPPHRCEKRKVNSRPAKSSAISAEKSAQPVTPNSNPTRGAVKDVLKFARLFQTQREMSEIMVLPFHGQKYQACGFDANVNNTDPKFLAPFRFIHFAVHSTINSDHPELSGLVLSLFDRDGRQIPEGILRLKEIYHLNLQSELVVLSACETIRGKEIRGEGIVGLTRGFMAAGARRVVTSLWMVSDQPVTVDLMRYFYQGMLDRRRQLAPAMALQEAQQRVLSEHPGLHPRYWAAFTIEGEYQRIPEP